MFGLYVLFKYSHKLNPLHGSVIDLYKRHFSAIRYKYDEHDVHCDWWTRLSTRTIYIYIPLQLYSYQMSPN